MASMSIRLHSAVTGFSIIACSLAGCLDAPDAETSTQTAAVLATPTVIASGQDSPIDVVADGGTAYWINANAFGELPGDIVSAPSAGGGAVAVLEPALTDVGHLAIDDARLYWMQGATTPGVGGIRSKPRAGGAAADVVTGQRVFAMALSEHSIYFASPDQGGRLQRVAKSGGAITTLASNLGDGLDNVPVIALSNDKVFFTQSTFGVACDGQVRSVSKWGGPVTTLASNVCNLLGLAADDAAVYWSEWDNTTHVGRIMRLTAPYTGAPTALDTLTIKPGLLALDRGSLYYTAGSFADAGIVAKVPSCGGPREVLAVDQLVPLAPSVDRRHVYWTTLLDGEVKRAPR